MASPKQALLTQRLKSNIWNDKTKNRIIKHQKDKLILRL